VNTAFNWISEFVYFLVRFFPHLVIVEATHGLIKFKRGWKVVYKGPGLRWYWPLVTKIVRWPMVPQPLKLSKQYARTKDKEVVAVEGVVIYEVLDLELLIAKAYEGDEILGDLAMAAVRDMVTKRSLNELDGEHVKDTDHQLSITVRKALKPYGVYVIKARLSKLAPTDVHYLTGLDELTGAEVSLYLSAQGNGNE
jgi:regulator of protease activity HflC (stomatin/prohibitin superfamily)